MKKRFFYLFLIFCTIFISRHWLFEKMVSFRPLTEHKLYSISDTSFKHYLDSAKPNKELDDLINDAVCLTTRRLAFASQNTEVDPNLSFHRKQAHCVGYAAFFATTCNFLLEKNKLSELWEAKHVRGTVSFLGVDLHQFSNNPFYRDHDFNVIINRKTGERFLVDTSIKDVLGIRFVKNVHP